MWYEIFYNFHVFCVPLNGDIVFKKQIKIIKESDMHLTYVMQQHDIAQRNNAYVIVKSYILTKNQFKKHLWWILVKRFTVFIFFLTKAEMK